MGRLPSVRLAVFTDVTILTLGRDEDLASDALIAAIAR